MSAQELYGQGVEMRLVKHLTSSAEICTFAAEAKQVERLQKMREGAGFRGLVSQTICTRMTSRRSMQRTLRKNSAGITFEVLQVLGSLQHEQGINQQISVERIAKGKVCLINLMNNLEKKEYVYRKKDPVDRRSRLVFLTPEGEEFKGQIRPIPGQVYVHVEKIIGIESTETILSKLKGVCDVLEGI